MKKRKGVTVKINFTNRWLYTLIILGVLIAVGVGVYAATYSSSGAGHPYTEISTCAADQILKMNSAGTDWTCANPSSGSETDPTVMSWAKTNNPNISGNLDVVGTIAGRYLKLPAMNHSCSAATRGEIAYMYNLNQDFICLCRLAGGSYIWNCGMW